MPRATHQAVDFAERLRSPRLTETLKVAAITMSPIAAHPDMASAIARIHALTGPDACVAVPRGKVTDG